LSKNGNLRSQKTEDLNGGGVLSGFPTHKLCWNAPRDDKGDEAPQLMVDLMRLTLLFGEFAPLICLTPAKATARCFGASEEIVEIVFDSRMQILSCSIISCNSLLLCDCLQSEDRSAVFGALQTTTSLLNVLVFDPLFLI
jgi:hypothetical protein